MVVRMIAAPTQAGIVLLLNKRAQAEHKFLAKAGTRLLLVSPFIPSYGVEFSILDSLGDLIRPYPQPCVCLHSLRKAGDHSTYRRNVST